MSYSFYVGKIVEVATPDDNRLRVRILPHMQEGNIRDEECPVYPSFFRDEFYTGRVGDYVWVAADEEFSLGYVFSLANFNTYPDKTKLDDSSSAYLKSADGVDLSIPADLRSEISKNSIELYAKDLSLSDCKITYWDSNCIHYIERATGGKISAFRNGTVYIERPDEFILAVGGKSGSIIKVTASGIDISSKGSIALQSDSVNLGINPTQSVLVNSGNSADCAVPSDFVKA